MRIIDQIKGQTPFLQVIVLILIGLVSSIVLGMLASFMYLGLAQENLSEFPLTMAKEQSLAFMLVNHLPFQLGMFLVPGLLYLKMSKENTSLNINNAIWGILLFACIILLLPFLSSINGALLEFFNYYDSAILAKVESDAYILNLIMGKSIWLFLVACLVIGLITGICEELFFRRFIYHQLAMNSGKKWLAIIVSSMFFAILHLNYLQILPLFLFGVVLALVYELSGKIVVGIVLHALNNVVNLYWMYTDSFPEFMEVHSYKITMPSVVVLTALIIYKNKSLKLT